MGTPRRKVLGDNPDAIYFDAPVDPPFVYKVRGNIGGAIYTSITIDAGTADGGYATRTRGINDTDFDVAPDGSYEVTLGGRHRSATGSSSPMTPGTSPPATTSSFRGAGGAEPDPRGAAHHRAHRRRRPSAGADADTVGCRGDPPGEQLGPRQHRRATTAQRAEAAVVRVDRADEFPKPVVPGDLGLATFDAAYCSASYVLAPDEALVITMRSPECRFGNVTLWTRSSRPMTTHRGRNRANTTLEPDGSFKIVIAHEDPGVPNWLDAEGRPHGTMYGGSSYPRATSRPAGRSGRAREDVHVGAGHRMRCRQERSPSCSRTSKARHGCGSSTPVRCGSRWPVTTRFCAARSSDGGLVVKTTGDGAYAAFATASDAWPRLLLHRCRSAPRRGRRRARCAFAWASIRARPSFGMATTSGRR